MKNKLLLLATAAAFMSPVAAKANQNYSIFVGATGTLERLATQGGNTAETDVFKDESFLSAGLEVGFGYKVWSNLQIAGWLRGLYGFEHKFDEKKKAANLPYELVLEPRLTVGWEFPVGASFTITPFIGAGAEMSWTKKNDKEFKMNWKIPGVVGIRANYGYVYATLSGRFDITASEKNEKSDVRPEADTYRNWGIEASLGAEF